MGGWVGCCCCCCCHCSCFSFTGGRSGDEFVHRFCCAGMLFCFARPFGGPHPGRPLTRVTVGLLECPNRPTLNIFLFLLFPGNLALHTAHHSVFRRNPGPFRSVCRRFFSAGHLLHDAAPSEHGHSSLHHGTALQLCQLTQSSTVSCLSLFFPGAFLPSNRGLGHQHRDEHTHQ